MVENGAQFAGIVGENRKKKPLDKALFLGGAEKLCAYVHFFLDYVYMRMARFFYFIFTTRKQGEQTMKRMWTHIDNLGEEANVDLFTEICEEVFAPFGNIEVLVFPGVDNTGDLEADLFCELLEECWEKYISHKYWESQVDARRRAQS